MASKRGRDSSSSGAKRSATTDSPVDVAALEKAADELQYVCDRPYAAQLIRTFLEEHRAAAEAAEE